jgi:hypothetical protein
MMKHERFIQECFKAIFLNISGASDPLKSLSNSAKPYKKFSQFTDHESETCTIP